MISLILNYTLLTTNQYSLDKLNSVYADKSYIYVISDGSKELLNEQHFEGALIKMDLENFMKLSEHYSTGYIIITKNVSVYDEVVLRNYFHILTILIFCTSQTILSNFPSAVDHLSLLRFNGNTLTSLNDVNIDKDKWKPSNQNRIIYNTFNCPPFSYFNKNTSQLIGGIEWYMLEGFNLNVEIRGFPDYSRDLVESDVSQGNADIAGCFLFRTTVSGIKNVVPSFPYLFLQGTLLVPKPKRASRIFRDALSPITLIIWFGSSLIVCLILHYMNRGNDLVYEYLITYSMMLSNASMSYRGKKLSIMILQIFWMITAILLGTAFSAGYTNILTIPLYINEIRNIHDVLEQKIALVYTNLNDAKHIIREDNKEVLKNALLWNSKTINVNNTAHIVYVMGKFIQYPNYLEAENVNLVVMKSNLWTADGSFALKNGSALETYISKKIIRYLETGLLDIWIEMVARNRTLASKKDIQKLFHYDGNNYIFKPLSFSDIDRPMLKVLIVYCIAFVICIIEIFTKLIGKM